MELKFMLHKFANSWPIRAKSIRRQQQLKKLKSRLRSWKLRIGRLRHRSYVRRESDGTETYVVEMPLGACQSGLRVDIFACENGKLVVVMLVKEQQDGDVCQEFKQKIYLPDYVDHKRTTVAVVAASSSSFNGGVLVIETPLNSPLHSHSSSSFN